MVCFRNKVKTLFFMVFASVFVFGLNLASAESLQVSIKEVKTQPEKKARLKVAEERRKNAIDEKLLGVPIPEGEGGFTSIGEIILSNDAGFLNAYAFIGYGSGKQFGLYMFRKDKYTKIVNQSTLMPDAVGYFTKIIYLSFDAKNGQIAFLGQSIFKQAGIYLYTGRDIVRVVDQQDFVPHTFTKFDHFGDISLDNGLVAFIGFDADNNEGLYLYSSTGIYKVLNTNDSINGKKVESIEMNYVSLVYNRIYFTARMSDYTTSDYVATFTFSPY